MYGMVDQTPQAKCSMDSWGFLSDVGIISWSLKQRQHVLLHLPKELAV